MGEEKGKAIRENVATFLHSGLNYASRIINGRTLKWGRRGKRGRGGSYVKQSSLLHDVNEFLTSDVTDWLSCRAGFEHGRIGC